MPVSITPILIASPRMFVGASQTVGAPIYGTLTALSGKASRTGNKAITPDIERSWFNFDAGIWTLIPFSADWNWARIFPPAAWICDLTESWLPLSWFLIWFFSEVVSFRPASDWASATDLFLSWTTTIASAALTLRG